MSPDEIRPLFEYNAWANRRSLAAVEKLNVEQFTKPMGSSFSSVRDTLAHIYGAEWIWLERFQGSWSQGLDALAIELARGKRERRAAASGDASAQTANDTDNEKETT